MLTGYEVGVIVVTTVMVLWFHVTMFLTKKPGSFASLVLVLALLGSVYYEFYQTNEPMKAYLLVAGAFFVIDCMFVALIR